MNGSNLAVLLDEVQDGSDIAVRLKDIFQEMRVCAEKEAAESKDDQRGPVSGKNLQHAERNDGN